MYVVNCTTPAQYFHVLRRHIGLRKPLVAFTPKSLLRHPRASSPAVEFTSGGFREVIGEASAMDANQVSRVLICSGKIYYDLLAAREAKGAGHDVAILRVEQLYPFPKKELSSHLQRYAAASDIVWVQEEPHNMGAWRMINDMIHPLRFIGRPESASPATGSYKTHQKEQQEIVDAAFDSGKIAPARKVRVVRRRK